MLSLYSAIIDKALFAPPVKNQDITRHTVGTNVPPHHKITFIETTQIIYMRIKAKIELII